MIEDQNNLFSNSDAHRSQTEQQLQNNIMFWYSSLENWNIMLFCNVVHEKNKKQKKRKEKRK